MILGLEHKNMKIEEIYKKNKNSKVGEMCICPSCQTKFKKEFYHQAFCKTQLGTKCKDKYWNYNKNIVIQ